jgi:hypothetical protein
MVLALFLSVESYSSHKLASGATIDVGLRATTRYNHPFVYQPQC